jgi:festuclavine dehydrogenase
MATIRDEGKIYTATGDGKIPFCSADDIAAVAFSALTAPKPPNREIFILGPELLTYKDVADALSSALGRTISHVSLSSDDLVDRLVRFGVPESGARGLAQMDLAISNGAEERNKNDLPEVLARQPKSLTDFITENRSVWG